MPVIDKDDNAAKRVARAIVSDIVIYNKAKIEAYAQRQGLRLAAKGHYFQRLRGWARPTDNDDEPVNDFVGAFPAWADVSVDVWEKPGGAKGWTLRIWVEEANLTQWVLAYDSAEGLKGWTQIGVTP